MNFKSCVKKVIAQLRHLNAAEHKNSTNTSENVNKRNSMAEGYTNNLQVRLEWARRKMADYVTEVNTTLICIEEIHHRIQDHVRAARRFEECVTARSIHRKTKNVRFTSTTYR